MNLFSKVLLLSCIVTSGLHCGFPEESLMEKQGIHLEITALLKVLKYCHQRDIYSKKVTDDVFARMTLKNEKETCYLAQANLMYIMEKIRRNYVDIIVTHERITDFLSK